MKPGLLILALLTGLIPAAQIQAQNKDLITVVEGNNQFALDLYRQLGQKPGNKFFSPYSISTALGMTYAGAKGQTAQEMAKTLHFTLEGEQLHGSMGSVIRQLQGKEKERPFKLSTVNRLWGQLDLKIVPAFLRITQTDYQSGLELVDFKKDFDVSRQKINRWVEEQTNSKIKDLLREGSINRDTRLVLTNAIYFKADWLTPFKKEATQPNDFTIPGKPAFKVPMMSHVMHPEYLAGNGFELVQLPYQGNEVSMVVILPKKIDGLADVEKKLSAKSLQQDLAKMKPAHVRVMMPKFKMTQEFTLNDELKSMGMVTAFDRVNADFTRMAYCDDGNLYISSVIHKAFVEVDEKGTEAAAATAVVIKRFLSAEPTPISFRADHPFLFLIRHNATGRIFFMGRVNDPRAN